MKSKATKRKPLTQAETIVQLTNMADAARGIARSTTGDADVREGMYDREYILREAIRHIGG